MKSTWNLTILWLCHNYVSCAFNSLMFLTYWIVYMWNTFTGKTPKNSKPVSMPRLEWPSSCQLDNTQELQRQNGSTHQHFTNLWNREREICSYLLHYKRIIDSLLQHEFTVCSLFNHNAFLKSSNSVSSPDGRQSVSNHNGGTSSPSLTEKQQKQFTLKWARNQHRNKTKLF